MKVTIIFILFDLELLFLLGMYFLKDTMMVFMIMMLLWVTLWLEYWMSSISWIT